MIPTIALPFKNMETHQQINFAKNIVQKMSADHRFQPLAFSIGKLSRKINEWQIAIANAKTGGKIKTITKIEKGLTVMDLVFLLASKVEIMAEHDESIIAAAGYKKQESFSFSKKAFSKKEIEEFLVAVA